MKIQVFLQSELLHDIAVVELSEGATINELRDACVALLPQEVRNSEFNLFAEDDDDEQALVRLARIPSNLRVHLHRLKGIDVTVRYAGRDVRRTFRPSATVGRIKRWSTQELGIAPADAADLMLQVHGSDVRPDSDVHVGTLVKAPNRAITFDLVPSPRING